MRTRLLHLTYEEKGSKKNVFPYGFHGMKKDFCAFLWVMRSPTQSISLFYTFFRHFRTHLVSPAISRVVLEYRKIDCKHIASNALFSRCSHCFFKMLSIRRRLSLLLYIFAQANAQLATKRTHIRNRERKG